MFKQKTTLLVLFIICTILIQGAKLGSANDLELNIDNYGNFDEGEAVFELGQLEAILVYLPIIYKDFIGATTSENFSKHLPANDAVGQSPSLTLNWGASIDATKYEYCYDSVLDNTCSNWTSVGAKTSVTLSTLGYSTTYEWHVRAYNDTAGPTYSNGSTSAFWRFTTAKAPPNPFDKISPTNGAGNQSTMPTLTWQSTTPVTRYEYCYDTTLNNSCTNWISVGTNTHVTLSTLGYSTTYEWHVRAYNDTAGPTYSNGSTAAFLTFTTQPPPPPPNPFNKISPTNGAGNQIMPTLTWQSTAPLTRYEYCYDWILDSACSNWTSVETDTSVKLPALKCSPFYEWHVRAYNDTSVPTYSNGSADAFWNFSTLEDTPSPLIETLYDDFDDGSIDTDKWTTGICYHDPTWHDPLVTVQETNRIEITTLGDVTGYHYNGLDSIHRYDLTASTAYVEAVHCSTDLYTVTNFILYLDSYNFLFFSEEQGRLYMGYYLNNTSNYPDPPISYDPEDHRWWRFRHETDDNSIHFDTSPDGNVWTERLREDLPFGITNLGVQLSAGTYRPRPPRTIIFDNFNIFPSAATSVSRPASIIGRVQ
jgi:hypothetical protein